MDTSFSRVFRSAPLQRWLTYAAAIALVACYLAGWEAAPGSLTAAFTAHLLAVAIVVALLVARRHAGFELLRARLGGGASSTMKAQPYEDHRDHRHSRTHS